MSEASDEQLMRDARHLLLDGVGPEGQDRIRAARVMLIGAGGLGCPAAMYLAASGVGSLDLVDHDQVDLSNLQRQIGHGARDVGRLKVDSLADTLLKLNPAVRVHRHPQAADEDFLNRWLPQVSLVLDCTDSWRTRRLIHRACRAQRVPLVSASALGWDGQMMVFDQKPGSPCYECAFPPEAKHQEAQCATMGVLSPLVGVMGSFQATAALHLLLNAAPGTDAHTDSPLGARLWMFDATQMSWTDIAFQPRPDCLCCQTHQEMSHG